MPLCVTNTITIGDDEIELSAIRSQGKGGQNVNKVATAIHLRFDIGQSTLPNYLKIKLMSSRDHHVSKDGVIIIKAQRFRTQDKNREDAIARLAEIIKTATVTQKKRRPTKPTKGSQKRRLEGKTRRSKTKALRGKVTE